MTMFRLITIRLHFSSKQYAWRIHLQENIMSLTTYVHMPEALEQTTFTSSGQLPTICGHSVAGESFFFSCCKLGQLAGPTDDATLIHVGNSIPGGGGVEFLLSKYST
jgi:hypothetical protein